MAAVSEIDYYSVDATLTRFAAAMRVSQFIREVRRRRVFRVAAMYVVGAWVALQVADLAFASWEIPQAALRYVWLIALLGFPVAVILGWRFDISGGQIIHAVEGDSSADLSLQRSDYLLLLALLLIIAAMLYSVASEIIGLRGSGSTLSETSPVEQKSIAVLPFADTSSREEDVSVLASGIQDELLTRLSKIADLKVISRTSVEQYRDTKKSIPEIGKELAVRQVLEGAVQRIGDEIRVHVQLINTETDEHVWAERFDRMITAANVFQIQTEIVESIARQLEASITPRETAELALMPTRNMSAYTEYLRGRQQARIESIESLNLAVAHFQAAIALDPRFALAYVGLADAYLTLGMNFFGGLQAEESGALAEPALLRALEIDPDLGEAHASLGLLRQQQGNMEAAEKAYQQAMKLRPNYARVFRLYARMRRDQGDRKEAIEFLQKALVRDPYSVPVNYDIARLYDQSGNFPEAMERYLRIIEIEPNHAFAYVYIAAIHYLVYGRPDESLVWYRKAAENDALSPSLQSAQAVAYLELGDVDSARKWVARGLELGPRTFWAMWTSLLLNFYVGDVPAADADARSLLEVYPRYFGALNLLRNADIAAGRFEVAASRYARAYRELMVPEVPKVDSSNYMAAVDLALVLMHLDRTERANQLLEQSLEVIGGLPRLGTDGYWITDVRIHALQGRTDLALAALRQAIDEGWRLLVWYFLDNDPNLEAIRGEAEFQRLRQLLKDDLAAQARRVEALKAAGEL